MALIRPEDPVRVLMSMPAVAVDPVTSLVDLAAKLDLQGVGALAVMTGDHLDGVVSERDVVRMVAAGGDLTELWAAEVMADEPVSADVDDPIAKVAAQMLEEGVRHVPVLSGREVLGVVSIRDVLAVFVDDWRRGGGNGR